MTTPSAPDRTPAISAGLLTAVVGSLCGAVVTLALLGHAPWWAVTAIALPPAVAAWTDACHRREVLRTGRPSRSVEPTPESVQLRHRALFDPLTGLPNRANLADRMTAAERMARRTGNATGVIVLDLDGFKAVNDRLGHGAGDELLVQCAVRLKGVLRSADTAARPGGDEFVVLCEGLAPDQAEAELEEVVERIHAVLSAPFMTTSGPAVVRASIGSTVVDGRGEVGLEALATADNRMLEAKRMARADDGPARHVPARATTAEDTVAPEPFTVVIVEDDPAMQVLAERILSVSGVAVIAQVSEPEDAVDVILQLRPDVVLCDVMMPRVSGPEVMARVHAEHPEQQFLFWSGVDHDKLDGLAEGHPWITKDRIDGLLDAVLATR